MHWPEVAGAQRPTQCLNHYYLCSFDERPRARVCVCVGVMNWFGAGFACQLVSKFQIHQPKCSRSQTHRCEIARANCWIFSRIFVFTIFLLILLTADYISTIDTKRWEADGRSSCSWLCAWERECHETPSTKAKDMKHSSAIEKHSSILWMLAVCALCSLCLFPPKPHCHSDYYYNGIGGARFSSK